MKQASTAHIAGMINSTVCTNVTVCHVGTYCVNNNFLCVVNHLLHFLPDLASESVSSGALSTWMFVQGMRVPADVAWTWATPGEVIEIGMITEPPTHTTRTRVRNAHSARLRDIPYLMEVLFLQ